MGVVYKVTNTANDKVYVGKTIVSLANRWRQHLHNARAGHKTYLYKAMRKYGADKFAIEIVDQALLAEEVEAKEVEWIAQLCATDPAKGYNCTTGGDSGLHAAASRNKIRRPMSAETRARLATANKGRKLSPEQRAKCANGRKGKRQTEEEKQKRAASLKKFWKEHPERRVANGIKSRENYAKNPWAVPVMTEEQKKEHGRRVSELRKTKYWRGEFSEEAREKCRQAAIAGWEQRRAISAAVLQEGG